MNVCTKYAFRILAVVFAAWTLRAAADAKPFQLDGYAALVNDKVITIGDVLEFIQPTDQQLTGLYAGTELEAKRHEAFTNGLATLIDRSLIVADFNKQGGTIPDRMVNDRVNEFIYDRFHNDRAAFLEALTEQQVTLEDWREDVKERLIISILRRQEVLDKIKVSPRLVRETYDARVGEYHTEERFHIRMIMLNKGDSPHEAEVKKAEAAKILERLKAGEDFGEIAKAESEGSRAKDGGDLSWQKPEDFRPELRVAVQALKPGQFTDVLETEEELYILKVEEYQAAGTKSFEDVRQSIEDELRQTDGERLYKAWTDRLRRKYFVQVFETDL